MSTLFNDLWQSGQLRTLDHALAQSLRRLDRDTPDNVLAAAALASLAVSKGHAGVSLAAPQALLESDAAIAWPHADDWHAQLAASRWVATPPHGSAVSDPHAPLVMEAGLLYLRRYREYERDLALGLQRIATHRPAAGDVHALVPLFAQLFPAAPIPTLPPQAGEGLKHAALAPTSLPQTDHALEPGTQRPLFGPDTTLAPATEQPLPPPAREGWDRGNAAPATATAHPDTSAASLQPLPPPAREGWDRGNAAPATATAHPDTSAASLQPLPPPAREGWDGGNAAPATATTHPDTSVASLQPLPPPAGEGWDGGSVSPAPNLQARAAALALRHALLLVTGGPGTGKTTTTARLLVLLAAQARQAGAAPPRIALAAPTGRAAERMAESVRHAVQSLAALGIDDALLAALPSTGTTLHRLLGTVPDSPRFRHHADNPLPFDVVVVDEASMIDLPLMAKLVDAVASGTRLVLLGDPDQLPSVEAGDVLSAILSAAGDGNALSLEDEALLHILAGAGHARDALASPTPDTPTPSTFPGIRVHLQRGYRQSDALDLAPLAAAVRAGDADGALQLLRGGRLSNVQFHEDLADPLHVQGDRLLAHWRALGQADSPAAALALSTQLRILTAVREGPQGARTLNARIERLLVEGTGTRPGPGHFHGQLIIVTQNSYRHRLFNGDIGICLRDGQGALVAWFPGDEPGQPRAFHPAALPAHESAFAMTVHKAQGSEFDTAWLLLPARGNRVLSRELVYTAITRARRELHVAGSEGVIRESLLRHASRWSGLGWRLG